MLQNRVIPILLLNNKGVYKTVKFGNQRYIGDPINIVKIFNEKEVDELVIFDTGVTLNKSEIDFKYLSNITSEAFMPLAYGGGIKNITDCKKLFYLGFEKVILNSIVHLKPEIIKEITSLFGSQSVAVCIDYKKNFWGDYEIFYESGKKKSKYKFFDFIKMIIDFGVGELIFQSVEKDGVMQGFDYELVDFLQNKINVPIIIAGGGKSHSELQNILDLGISPAAASMFIYYGKHNAVLISYPNESSLNRTML
ncbi:MAG: imidazole glycerol phosphate synthase subunit HisF [Cytophagaceae bacterium]|nr:imidazole glycerol phosphate synthase subunit HisF [Cytophagaceae bacterium]